MTTATAPPARLPAGVLAESPYIGSRTFGAEEEEAPYLLRIGLPVTAEMIIAALYCDRSIGPADIADDDGVWRHAALDITRRGTIETGNRACLIRTRENAGTLADPGWLACCRRRAAELLGPAWHAAPYRCPCGYATCDPRIFAGHTDPARGGTTGHRAVTGTATLAELWEQHPAAARG